MPDGDCKYDIVLWGATGFTGWLVAEYVAQRYDTADFTWALAGRNRDKLETLRTELGNHDADWASVDIVLGDASDRERLGEIAERSQVVCSTVGPYTNYGTNMVDACVEHGTDYCDLTGELHWIRRMIDTYHDSARERSVRIVHACGFDSVPSDLGMLLVQRYAETTVGAPCATVHTFASDVPFTPSDGTMASMVEMFDDLATDPDTRQILNDPYALAPAGKRNGLDDGVQRRPRYDVGIGQWTAPFAMAAINEPIVRRSNALLGYPWGRNFRYNEAVPTGSGLSGAIRATGLTTGLAFVTGAMSVTPLRRAVSRNMLPDPGEGPSRETIADREFEISLLGPGWRPRSGERFTVEGSVRGDRDPAYGATPQMIAEAAVCLATDDTETPVEGGVLTPASGIGTPLVDRLEAAGLSFSVEERSLVEN